MISSLMRRSAIRSVVRRIGWTGFYRVSRRIYGEATNEISVKEALLGVVVPGDCVWDVGANVGVYTRLLAERVGGRGRVLAMEPCFGTFQQLLTNTRDLAQVECLQIALGAYEQELRVAAVDYSPGFSLVRQVKDGERVHVISGREAIREGCPHPNVVKIDVEGYEEDTLWGMREALTQCRAIFMEIHFALLEERGYMRAPDRMVSLLKDLGFQVGWLDQGHLRATREKKRERSGVARILE